MPSSLNRTLLVAVVLAGVASGAAWRPAISAPPGNASGQSFTLEISSAYARRLPSLAAEPVFSAFEGQSFAVLDSSLGGEWLQVGYHDLAGWLPARFGSLSSVPGLAPPAAPATGARLLVPPGVVPVPGERVAAIFRRGLELGNNPRVFAKVGDCNSENGRFLVMFDQPGAYDLGPQGHLQATIDHFAGSFGRVSVAARSGFSPASVMDPTWADPAVCQPGEGPLQCEYRLLRPSFAIIALGTHNAPTIAGYEADLRAVIEASIDLGVVPVITTKADNVEGGDRVNAVMRRLAAEYQVPLWDFWAAVQPLPAHGLSSDGIHLTYGRAQFGDDWAMTRGWTWRNLTALLTLESLLLGVIDGPEEIGLPYW